MRLLKCFLINDKHMLKKNKYSVTGKCLSISITDSLLEDRIKLTQCQTVSCSNLKQNGFYLCKPCSKKNKKKTDKHFSASITRKL